MAAEASGPAVAEEIAELLDQCTPEELTNILQAIEGTAPPVGGSASAGQAGAAVLAAAAAPQQMPPMAPVPPAAPAQQAPAPRPVPAGAVVAAPAANSASAGNGAPTLAPVPPAGRPPSGGGRRPPPRVVKKADENTAANGAPLGEATTQGIAAAIPMDDLRRLLEEHSAGVLSEVRKMLPATGAGAAAGGGVAGGGGSGGDTIDMGLLAEALLERDREVQQLEARLTELQAHLASKDKRVAELGGELDQTVREVRHRQLDLELQQLKLEERVRSNAELEQAQRNLSARVEEASLNARHAALDLDLCRATPRAIRAQGALPWTLRKNRLPAVLGAAPESTVPNS